MVFKKKYDIMIFAIQNGRLGNQLFQYNFIKSIQKKRPIVLFGFKSLKYFCNEPNIFFINNFFSNILIKYRYLIIKTLKKTKIFNIIYENKEKKILNINGLLNNFTLVDGFFASPLLVDKKAFIKINTNFHSKIDFQNAFFVHIRLGDFNFWPSKKNSAVIDINWYIKCIKLIKKKFKSPIFYLFSDEIKKIKNKFILKQCQLIQLNEVETFKFMTNCKGGVLSASTFGWWAAYFSTHFKNKQTYFIAPKYWAGHKIKKYYPEAFKHSKFLEFINL